MNALDDFRAALDDERVAKTLMKEQGLARLEASIPGLKIETYGGMLPVQAEGTLHAMPFYFRHRSGPATLNLSSPGTPVPHGGRDSLYSASYEGSLDPGRTEDFIHVFRELVQRLERSPWLWTYEGAEVKVEDGRLVRTGQLIEFSAYTHTEEEALAQICEDEPLEADRVWTALHLAQNSRVPAGFTPEAYWDLVSLSPQPLRPDDRVFPPQAPPFTVLPLGS